MDKDIDIGDIVKVINTSNLGGYDFGDNIGEVVGNVGDLYVVLMNTTPDRYIIEKVHKNFDSGYYIRNAMEYLNKNKDLLDKPIVFNYRESIQYIKLIEKHNDDRFEKWDEKVKENNLYIDKEEKEKPMEKLDGKYGFFMFLFIIDELKNKFIKTRDYMNINDFYYFFTTDIIKNKFDTYDILEQKNSIKKTFETFKEIKKERLSFYFGIIDDNIEYGFFDDVNLKKYKTGEFKTSSTYIKGLKNYKCLKLIQKNISSISIKEIKRLHQVKADVEKFLNDIPSTIKIFDDKTVIKTISKDKIGMTVEEGDRKLHKVFKMWAKNFKWEKYFTTYTDIQDNDILFYVKRNI